MDPTPAFDQVLTAAGGGVTGILGYALYLFLSGRLKASKTVDEQLKAKDDLVTIKDKETEWLHGELDKERTYSKSLVAEMQEQNDLMRKEVLPSLTAVLQYVFTEKAKKQNGD